MAGGWLNPAFQSAGNAPLPDGVEFRDAWTVTDVCVFDGRALVCPVEITAKQIPTLRLDAKKPPGFDGGNLTPQGLINAVLEMKLHGWTNAHFEAMDDFVERYWRKPLKDFRDRKVAKGSQPIYTIAHPYLAPIGISQVIVTAVGLPVDAGSKDHKTVSVQLHQWIARSQKKAPAKTDPQTSVVPQLRSGIAPSNVAGRPPSSTLTPKKRT
jgi:hypothetical protein